MSDVRKLGSQAEDRAADFLAGLGYTIVTRRYRVGYKEIDIVALDGDTLVFVEVKHTRDSTPPEAKVTAQKLKNMREAAKGYFEQTGQPDMRSRFDLIAIDGDTIRHHVAVDVPHGSARAEE